MSYLLQINTNLTLGENIADNSAIKTAFKVRALERAFLINLFDVCKEK